MKKMLIAGLGVLMLGPVSTHAAEEDQAKNQALDIEMEVPAVCILGEASTGLTAVAITTLNAKGADSTQTITFGDSYCNASNKISLTSANTGMVPGAGTASINGFDMVYHYKATVSNWSNSPILYTGSGNFVENGGADAIRKDGSTAAETLTLTIETEEAPNPLVSAEYSDTLTLSIYLSM